MKLPLKCLDEQSVKYLVDTYDKYLIIILNRKPTLYKNEIHDSEACLLLNLSSS